MRKTIKFLLILFLTLFSLPGDLVDGTAMHRSSQEASGKVRGRIYARESRQPTRGVLLTINEAKAITDSNGRFVFDRLKPGNYFLNVDDTTIPVNHVPINKMPMIVTVRPGSETKVKLPITRAADVVGQILIYGSGKESLTSEFNRDDGSDSNGDQMAIQYMPQSGIGKGSEHDIVSSTRSGLSRTLIELGSTTQIRRRVSDEHGRFVFRNLPHGRWVLKIKEFYLPENHYVEKHSSEIYLRPGEKKDALVRVFSNDVTLDFARGDIPVPSEVSASVGTTADSNLMHGKQEDPFNYTVKAGDWLSKIAAKFYGDKEKYGRILAANREFITNPDLIYPGQRLRIPNANDFDRYYTVRPGDWLSRIARTFYHDDGQFHVIFEVNRDILNDPDLIFPGQKLRIPPSAIGGRYTVKPGDWLSRIAQSIYGDPDFSLLYAANRNTIKHPDVIYPGQQLRVPTKPSSTRIDSEKTGAAEEPNGYSRK